MGGCSSRPQAPPVPQMPQAPSLQRRPSVEQWIQQALVDESWTELFIEDEDRPPPSLTVNDARPARSVEGQIQSALANGRMELELSTIVYMFGIDHHPSLPLTVPDARRIICCFRENPQFDTLTIRDYDIHNAAVLDVLRSGLPLCTSVATVNFCSTQLGNEGLDRLRPVFYNTSVTSLQLYDYSIQGQDGGEVLRDLLFGNDALLELNLRDNSHFGPEVAIGFGQGLTGNHGLQVLNLESCKIGNDFLANLLPADGMINNSLLHLDLTRNSIEGEDGGRQVSLLLQRFTALRVLKLDCNYHLGPLGARALAPGLAAASHLERLKLSECGLGNDGVANLIPDGQENRSLTTLNIRSNDIHGLIGGENVIALVSRCTNLDSLYVGSAMRILSLDQQDRLDLLQGRKRLVTEASALAGSAFPVLFHFVEKACYHEQGLSAIFVILQNDGEDYFCTALNRGIE